MEKQAATETEPELLIELAEEMEYKKGNVASLAQALKETIPAEFKERAQQAMGLCQAGRGREAPARGSAGPARVSQRGSEAGSYKGPMGPVAGRGPEYRLPVGAPERGRRTEEDSSPTADDLGTLLRGWGQLRANDNGWPTFDG